MRYLTTYKIFESRPDAANIEAMKDYWVVPHKLREVIDDILFELKDEGYQVVPFWTSAYYPGNEQRVPCIKVYRVGKPIVARFKPEDIGETMKRVEDYLIENGMLLDEPKRMPFYLDNGYGFRYDIVNIENKEIE